MRAIKNPFRRGIVTWGLSTVLLGAVAGCSSETPTEQAARQAEFEKQFQESMSDVTLEGYFTMDGADPGTLRKENYHISSVTKLAGDIWTFQTRIQYGERDVTLPIPVKLVWADDTPMVSLTDTEIPGLGTFTARVVFYGDRYAGMWSHGERGGNQFGRIIRGATPPPASEPAPEAVPE